MTMRGYPVAKYSCWMNHLLRTRRIDGRDRSASGGDASVCAVPLHPHVDAFDFRAATMRPLFSYADECAQADGSGPRSATRDDSETAA